jgi:threonine dehydratase
VSIISFADIDKAAERISKTAIRTPLVDVSVSAGRSLVLKCENLQVTGSFKIRGALNMITQIPPNRREAGVVTYSSGNHAQAVAYAAREMGIPAVVVMPRTAASIKIDGARGYGAEVLFEGTTSVERRLRAEREAALRGLTMIPPFDHPDIIAGQATVGLELLEDVTDITRVYVPVGGGGLISGIAAALKHAKSSTKVIGVEPVGASCMVSSLAAGHPVSLDVADSLADGLLPVRPGDLTFSHVQTLVDEMVTVEDSAIERAVVWLCRHAKVVVEPSGAVSVAAALMQEDAYDSGLTVAVLSGGNISLPALVDLLKTPSMSPSQ